MPEPLLVLDALEVRYGAVPAVRGLSLEVGRGEIVGLIGPNGAGKSTTLHAVTGLVPVHAGDVRLAGRSLAGRSPEAIARAGLALVPEGRRIFATFTVEENLRLGLAARRDRDEAGAPNAQRYHLGTLGRRVQTKAGTASGALGAVYELFPILGEFRRRSAGALSGGQQQQLAIGRALVADPELLLLDEPSLGLAPKLVDSVFAALGEIRERGVTVLLVEQRAQRTVAFADRTHVLANGELRMTLGPADADDTEKMIAAYLS